MERRLGFRALREKWEAHARPVKLEVMARGLEEDSHGNPCDDQASFWSPGH